MTSNLVPQCQVAPHFGHKFGVICLSYTWCACEMHGNHARDCITTADKWGACMGEAATCLLSPCCRRLGHGMNHRDALLRHPTWRQHSPQHPCVLAGIHAGWGHMT